MIEAGNKTENDSYARYGAVRAKLFPLGDSAVAVQFGETIDLETHERVRQLADYLERHPFEGMVEYVPAFLSVTVYYEPFALLAARGGFDDSGADADPYGLAARLLAGILAKLGGAEKRPARIVDIPVCYGGDLGPDLAEVAAQHGLTEQDVIDIHASADYLVYMLGFAPGFAYLGGLPARIATPRRTTPRLSIPAGTVGIAGDQTGVYPIVTPGGWQLIGKTPLPLFLPEAMPPTLLKAGDLVRFRPISRAEFDRLEVERT
ncbi:5-oxoprolinase subunit PxpB [Paenibacillus sp. UNC496MF]|uniref:5-oxoprolinase subunit PxpB n=1 Tax=Paenibacillus sp. UNC496MF TaxID=1502753 RepID=UPI000B80A01D|nr:5-oxoprolinase subunit PxpB [Paenibacillus sp. UNC496MF]